jgi:hypothetical protein
MIDSESSAPSITLSTTTTVGNDLLTDANTGAHIGITTTYGAGQTEMNKTTAPTAPFGDWSMTYKAASGSPGTETMSRSFSPDDDADDLVFAAIKGNLSSSLGSTTNSTYTYAGTGYADPNAVTQIANGLSTTTFTYDNNGNVTQKTTDGTTTTYVYDYANRLTALGVGGATTTYGYDWSGSRVSQTGTSTTWIYPFKWYSVASSTGSGAQYATTTDYVFNGDTLVATIDQETASGNATGTPATHYIHPDHLGSTNVVAAHAHRRRDEARSGARQDERSGGVQTSLGANLNQMS